MSDLVRAAGAARPDAGALIAGAGSEGGPPQLTWRELDGLVDRVARALAAAGLLPGDRIAVGLRATLEFAAGYYGALRAGLVAVPYDEASGPTPLRHLLADSDAAALLTHGDRLGMVRPLRAELPGLRQVWVCGPFPDELSADRERPFPSLIERDPPVRDANASSTGAGEDLAMLAYTSGVSGPPRGAMLTHRALLADLDHLCRIDPPFIGPDDVVLVAAPLFTLTGTSVLNVVVRQAAQAVLAADLDPVTALELVRRHRATVVVAPASSFDSWSGVHELEEMFASVRLAVSGAAELAPEVQRRLRSRTGTALHTGYGCTEAAPTITSTLMSEALKPGSLGRPVPGVQLRLVEPSTEPAEVVTDDPGEIMVRGDNLFSGYWPDATAGPDREGWWRTADVGYLDLDGDLHLVDRRYDVILVRGFPVYPREVEHVLAEHPAVGEAAVIGVPDQETGEAVRAFVVPRLGVAVTTQEVGQWAERHLPAFKRPAVIEIVEGLPHTSTGRLRRADLRDGQDR